MQNVDFGNIEEFLAFLPNDELPIVELLRNIIFDCMPECEERLVYNVPYFRRHKNICFIWPGSVTWGNSQRKGVRLGFINGNLMADEINYLDKGDRKFVYWKDFFDMNDIDPDLVKSYIFQAIIIDGEKASTKRK